MYDWRRIWLVARRELLTRYAQKTFRATLVIQILVALLAALAPVGIAKFSHNTTQGDVIVVDQAHSGLAERFSDLSASDGTGQPAMSARSDVSDVDAARKLVKDGKSDVAIVVTGDPARQLSYEIISGNKGVFDVSALRARSVIERFNAEQRFTADGLAKDDVAALQKPAPIVVQKPDGSGAEQVDESTKSGGAKFGVTYILVFVMYMAIIMLGSWIAQGVVEEKASRIMEIMVNAATPRDLLVGKVLGILGAGLTMLLPMLAISGTTFMLSPRIAKALDVDLKQQFNVDFTDLSLRAIGVFLLFFLFGFLLYGALYAAVASLVSRQEEVNQAVSPVLTLVIVGFFASFVVMSLPKTLFAKILMYVPLTSPYVAVPRAILGDASWGEIGVSLAILVVTSIAAFWLAARVYRVGVLMYGQKPGFKTLLSIGRLQTVAR